MLATLLGVLLSAAPVAAEVLPGVPAHPKELAARLDAALVEKGADYLPRTHHLRPDGAPKYRNRLLLESSPYLLQHAHNPVNWYPWGDEAFERAARENKPVLLSIGYSTCHWCHVMERESFEDEEVARYLNEHYVAIKVDRERRPDVDGVYMAALHAMGRRGGWPLNVWLTAAREPFFGGTYFPTRDGDRGSRVGFLTLLGRLRQAYLEDGARVRRTAGQIVDALQANLRPEPGEVREADLRAASASAAASFRESFDEAFGGFGGAPKFPRPVEIEFLLRHAQRSGDSSFREIALRSLDAMAAGGIRDHVGGGFHRYAVDREWRVPHFEKMLYDNAQLAVVYLEGFQASGSPELAAVAREVLDYLEGEMLSGEGALYSATDADSEGEEGRFFTWTRDDLRAALGPERAPRFEAAYGVTAEGELDGRNILYRAGAVAGTREDLKRLYEVRAGRVPPLTDRKVLASWNGLALSAFARAALVLDDEGYADRAASLATFLLGPMRAPSGHLFRSRYEGRSEGQAFLDDYAFVIQGLLDLFELRSEPRWLRAAVELQAVLDRDFADAEGGGYFRTAASAEALLAREKPSYDGAEPTGNSVSAANLLRLADLTMEAPYRARAQRLFGAFREGLTRNPTSMPKLLAAAEYELSRAREILIVSPVAGPGADALLAPLRKTFLPHRVLATLSEGPELAALRSRLPILEGKSALGGRPTAYVCERGSCQLPTADPSVFATQLREATAAAD